MSNHAADLSAQTEPNAIFLKGAEIESQDTQTRKSKRSFCDTERHNCPQLVVMGIHCRTDGLLVKAQ